MAFTTKGSLLTAVKNGDEISWQQFYDMYKPLILLKGGDLRLNQTEKEELVQLVMLSFFNTSQTFCYDKSKGRFRDYLKRIIHNKACDLMRKRHDGEISVEEKDGKLIWKCPNCGNMDQTKMNVARRTCGYIGSQFWNQGRTQEIKDRVLHL